MATKTYNAQTLLVAAKPRNKRLREIGYQGGSSATVDVDLTPYLLKATFDDLFEKVNLGTEEAPKWSIKAKYGLWTEGFLSAKGVGDGSAEGGVGYEAVQEMIADALAGYNPAATDVNWTDIVGKPDTFAPSAHQHTVADITDLATTLSGYSTTGHEHTKAEITDFAHTHSWNDITSNKPTTLGGYGITDAVPNTRKVSAGTGLTGGGTLAADRTISLNATNVGLLQMLSDMFEWQTVGGVRTIKAKASLWTEGFLSAKGVGDGSAEGISYEAVQEMIDDALAGYNPSTGEVDWDSIVGKPDAFNPASHTHSYLPLSGGTVGNGANSSPLAVKGTTESWIKFTNSSDAVLGYFGFTQDTPFAWFGGSSKYLLHSGNYSSYALPLSGGTMTGGITMGNKAIYGENGAGLLVHHPPINSWTGADNTKWSVGTIDSQGVIRSDNTNLIHYRSGASSPSSVILDSANYTDYAVPNTRKVSAGTGLTGGGDLTADRTIKLTDKNVALLAMLDSMFEKVAVNGVDTIKAKMSLWTNGYLSAKGTSNDSSASGLTAEAVQEMIADALVGYTPGDGVVEWNDIVGKPDAFAPSSHTHSYLPLSGGTVGNGANSSPLAVKGTTESWIKFTNSSDAVLGYFGFTQDTPFAWFGGSSKYLLHSGNYNSYALPLTGGTLTGNLTVNGTVTANGIQSGSHITPNSDYAYNLGTQEKRWRYGLFGWVGNKEGEDFSIGANYESQMTFKASGNVGIGTTSPASKLHVSGTATANGFAIPNTNGSLTCKDSTGTAFAMVCYNSTNLWIGANAESGYHHAGNTFISGGTTGKVYCCVPSAENYGGTSYEMLHAGNYTNWAVPKTRTVSAGTGLTGGGDLTADRTIKLTDKNVALLAMLDSMFEVSKVNGVDTIKAKMSLWTEGYLSAKGTSNDSSASGLTAEAVQEMIDDALVGYTPGDGVVEWTDIVGKPDTFAPSSHTHSYLPLAGGTLTGTLHTASDKFFDSGGGINMHNSDIIGVNSIFTNDIAEDFGEGIIFARSDSKYDILTASGGALYFKGGANRGDAFSTGNVVLHSGNYSSYALPLSGGTMTGGITMGNKAIYGENGAGLLVHHPPINSWTGADNTKWSVGTIDSQGVIRSNNTDLVHYRHGASTTATTILDSANYSAYITKSYVDGLGVNASTVGGYSATGVLERQYTRYLDQAQVTTGWYRIAETHQDGAWGCAGTIYLMRSHNNHNNESYVFDIVANYRGGNMITQTAGNTLNQVLTKIRVVYPTTGASTLKSYVEVYYNASAGNNLWITCMGAWSGMTPTKVSADVASGYAAYEMSIGGGFKTLGSITAGSHITPNSDNAYDIGSQSARWRYGLFSWVGNKEGEDFSIGANYTSQMTFKASGNVGIGTTSPAYKLDVAGDTRVGGKIIIHGTNTSNDTRFITSDNASNIYFSVGGVESLIVRNDCVRRGSAATSVSSGTSIYPWNGVYATADATTANNDTGFVIPSAGRIGGNSSGGLGVYAIDPLYLRFGCGSDYSNASNGLVLSSSGSTLSSMLTVSNKININSPSGTDGMIYCQLNGGTQIGFGVGTSTKRGVYDRGLGWVMYTNGTNVLFENGKVGIGTTSPDAKLHVAGAVHATTGVYSEGYITSNYTASSSDERLKDIKGDMLIPIGEIAYAPSVRFQWRDSGREDVGSIAQYWQRLLPEAIREDARGYLTMPYGKLAMLSVISVARDVMDNQHRIAMLEAEVERLKKQLTA